MLAAGLAASGPAMELPDDFGRWEQQLQSCQLDQSGGDGEASGIGPQRCQTLRLNQQVEGLISVRFIGGSEGQRYSSRQMLFAGILAAGSRAMECQQGRCSPTWPIELDVNAVASMGFDDRGLALGVPRAQLARGRCRISPEQVSCSARGTRREQWSAEARF
jgi:hypothetical protein